jgi:peptidoglycan/xylan/chitin deacetylase (PgdA/CDA1 family)
MLHTIILLCTLSTVAFAQTPPLVINNFLTPGSLSTNLLGEYQSDDGSMKSVAIISGALEMTGGVNSYWYSLLSPCSTFSYAQFTGLSFSVSCPVGASFLVELQVGACGSTSFQSKYLSLICPTGRQTFQLPWNQFGLASAPARVHAILVESFSSDKVYSFDDFALTCSGSSCTGLSSSSRTTALSSTTSIRVTSTTPRTTTSRSTTSSSVAPSTTVTVGTGLVIEDFSTSTSLTTNKLGRSHYCWLSTGCKSSYDSTNKALSISISKPTLDQFAEATWETVVASSETNACRDLSSFKYLRIVVSGVAANQDWTIRLASSNPACLPEGNPQFVSYAELLASKYVQGFSGGVQEMWIPLSHFVFASGASSMPSNVAFDLRRGGVVSFWSFRNVGSIHLHAMELMSHSPANVFTGIAPIYASPLITSCAKPRTLGIALDDGVYELAATTFQILQSRGINVTTIFTRGDIATNSQFTTLYKQYIAAGKIQIGAHTYSHPYMNTLTDSQIVQEMESTQVALTNSFGSTPRLYRPPFGVSDARVREVSGGLGLTTVLWNVDIADWRESAASGQLSAFKADVDAYLATSPDELGALLVGHFLTTSTTQALPQMLDYAISKGLKIMSVDECMKV